MTDTPNKIINPDVERIGIDLLHSAAEIDEWDLPPVVALTTWEDNEPTSLHPIVIPASAWRMAHAPVVLIALADMVNQGKMRFGTVESYRADQLTGLLFCFESWGANTTGMTRREADELHKWGETHSYADHPRGYEGRCMAMLDRFGGFCFAEHVRGTEPPTRARQGEFSGRVLVAMQRFMAAMEAHPEALMHVPADMWPR